jgi:hypothetical protein
MTNFQFRFLCALLHALANAICMAINKQTQDADFVLKREHDDIVKLPYN